MIRRTLLTLALVATAVSPVALHGAVTPADPAACWEDEPCFDCFTMGNGSCGLLVDDQGQWWPCHLIDRPCDEEG